MVADSRTPLRADQLRALNVPRPLHVICDKRHGPVAIQHGARRWEIAAIQDSWRLDDEWWRVPIERIYYLVELAHGSLRTLYRDLRSDAWYSQHEEDTAYPIGHGPRNRHVR